MINYYAESDSVAALPIPYIGWKNNNKAYNFEIKSIGLRKCIDAFVAVVPGVTKAIIIVNHASGQHIFARGDIIQYTGSTTATSTNSVSLDPCSTNRHNIAVDQ